MDAKKEMDRVMRMMVGDFNENHDPDTGRFTEGGGSNTDIQAKVRAITESGGDWNSRINDLMDLVWDHPEEYYEILEQAGEYGDQLEWELGPDNTNAFEERINPAIEAKKREYAEKLPAPKKNQSTSAVFGNQKFTLRNVRNAEYPNASRSPRFIETLVTDPRSGERLGSYADIDYTSAMNRIYRLTGFRTNR